MDWTNWQTYAALAVILITIGVFVRRLVKAWLGGNKKDCGGGRCGCDAVRKRDISKTD